jgi:Fe-Mn family superoxide dismutase
VRESAKDPASSAVFHDAAQAWNHTFFWACLTPHGGQPTGKLKDDVERDFGGVDKFREQFANEGAAQFGSGWVWLVAADGKLKI